MRRVTPSLSADFKPTATEDGGQRENAYHKDSKGSFKVGITPTQPTNTH